MPLKSTPEIDAIIRKSGDSNFEVAIAAQRELAVALTLPLRDGIMSGDILDNIFEVDQLAPDAAPEYPLSFLAPGTEKDFVAYTMPNHGYIPQRRIEGDFVMVPTYRISNAIDWELRYARSVRWPILGRAMEVLNAGFVKKMNDDGWHVLLAAAVDRNILVFDSDATAGQFTKRLVSLTKNFMRRNGGGNSSSQNRTVLTDLYLSPEAIEDMRNWGVDQVDEVTRRELYINENSVNRAFNVNLHDRDELGEGQEYQDYVTGTLGGSLAASDTELLVGLDLSKNNSFIMPVREAVSIFEDSNLHRQGLAGYYGWAELGFAVLDNRNVILASC